MTRSITFDDVLRAAILEHVLLEQTSKKENGVYELPKQADNTYYVKFENTWRYVFFDENGYQQSGLVRPAKVRRLEKQARFVRKLKPTEEQTFKYKSFKPGSPEQAQWLQQNKLKQPSGFSYRDPETGETEVIATKDAAEVTVSSLSKQSMERIAKAIWDSKGLVWDDEASTINSFARINTAREYEQINDIFKKQYSDGRSLTEYVNSFLSIADRCSIAALLYQILKPSDYYILRNLVSYAEVKRVVAWVNRNYGNSIYNSLKDAAWNADIYNNIKTRYYSGMAPSVQDVFDQINAAIQFQFPGGDITNNVPKDLQDELLSFATVKQVLSAPDRVMQTTARWTNSGAKMVWKYLFDTDLYVDRFIEDMAELGLEDWIAHASAAVGVSTDMGYDELMTSLRDKVYSTEGIATAIVLDKIPGVNIAIKAVFILLAIHDVYRIAQGDYWALLELVFDLLGILGAEQIAAVLKPIGNVIKRIIAFLRQGKVITSAMKQTVKTALKSLGSTISNFLKTLTGINIGQIITDSIQYIKDGIVALLEKAGFAKIADAIKQKLINFKTSVVTLYDATIGRFFQFINECLTELVGETAAPVVKSTAKALTGLVLIDNAINWIGSEKAKQEMEQLNQERRAQNDEMLDQAMQKRFGRDWKTAVVYFAYKYPLLLYRRKKTIDNKVEFKPYIEWNPESDNNKSYAPIMLAGQSAESGYMRVSEMYTDGYRTKRVHTFNELNTKAVNEYIYIKISDVWKFNKQPLDTYTWYKEK